MKRLLLIIGASSLVLALLAGGAVFLAARSFIGPRVADAAALGSWGDHLAPEIKGLHGIPPGERFEHFLGGEMRFRDSSNVAHTVSTTPGTVSQASNDKLTITANDGGSSRTYNLTAQTRIHARGQHRGAEPAVQVRPAVGDKVVVVTMDGSSDARTVMIGGQEGFRPHGGPWRRGS